VSLKLIFTHNHVSDFWLHVRLCAYNYLWWRPTSCVCERARYAAGAMNSNYWQKLNLEPGVRLIFIVSAGVLCPERLKKNSLSHLIIWLSTISLASCSIRLEKLTGFQLAKKFPAFYGTRRFITAFTSVRHQSLSWASSIYVTKNRIEVVDSSHEGLLTYMYEISQFAR
jgi:hypothetical protein